MDTLGINGIKSYASSLATNASTDALTDKAKSAKTDEELMDACKEFEDYLWEQVLKSMKSTVDFSGESNSSASSTVDLFMDSAISDIAKEMTEKSMGPNSLAMQMYEQMKRENVVDVDSLLASSAMTPNGNNKEE